MIEVAPEHKKFFGGAGIAFLVVLSLYFAVRFLGEARTFIRGGSGDANTITMSGYGEVSAAPDVANVYFSIEKEAKTVKEAQDQVALVEKEALDFLRENNIDEKDFKATNASFYPKYETAPGDMALRPCNEFYCPPVPGKTVLVGYVASESITVKIRNVDTAGEIMSGLGELGVTQLSGPDFTIDDEDIIKAEARKAAIEDAHAKAKSLARDLGVRLGRVVTFAESDYGFPVYARMEAMDSAAGAPKATPAELPKGENLVTSNVTITYEIR